MTILALAEHDNTIASPALLHTLRAAQEIGGEVHVLVTGSTAGAIATGAAQIPAVAKVLHADAAHLDAAVAENIAATMVDLVQRGRYSHVLFAATGFGKNI